MRKTLSVLCLTLLSLVVLDLAVAGLLSLAESRGKLGSLTRYFEYGRSVPGKLQRWEDNPGIPGNLYDIAWRDETIAASYADFAAEPGNTGPVIRSYGMSFVNNVLRAAKEANPSLILDLHAGPGAPPNFTYALFHDDRENRRAGDIAVFGILSSAVPALGALSNSTWVFEQPAPFSYPAFHLEGEGLRQIDPLITSAAQMRSLKSDLQKARAWRTQLASEDAFYSPVTFGAGVLDQSPFLRLVRRSLAKGHITRTESAILSDEASPHAEILRRMITQFAQTARADDQHPLVVLIQTRNPGDANLLEIAKPVFEQNGIAYFATQEHFNPRDASGFLSDGHYKPEIDRKFGIEIDRVITELSKIQ